MEEIIEFKVNRIKAAFAIAIVACASQFLSRQKARPYDKSKGHEHDMPT